MCYPLRGFKSGKNCLSPQRRAALSWVLLCYVAKEGQLECLLQPTAQQTEPRGAEARAAEGFLLWSHISKEGTPLRCEVHLSIMVCARRGTF